MNFKKYQHIEKLGTTEVEGILEGQVSLFYTSYKCIKYFYIA